MKSKVLIQLLLIAVVIIINSCDHSVYRKWDKKSFPDYIWEIEKEIIFEPVIQNIDRTYRIIIGIRHIYGMNIKQLPLEAEIVSPSGKSEIKYYTIIIADEKGRSKADCSGSLCDIETVVENEYLFYEQGKHHIKIRQNSSFVRLSGIMELGLILK